MTRVTLLWHRAGLPLVFVALVAVSVVTSPSRVRTSDEWWALARSLFFFYMMWRIIRQGELAVQRLEERDAARLKLLQSAEDHARSQVDLADELRRFTEHSTATVAHDLAAIRAELAQNTAITSQGATAGAEAARLALDTAAKLASSVVNQRDSLAQALVIDREIAAVAREEIKTAVANVHKAAKDAYHEANDVNKKIKNLNERLLTEETKDDGTPSQTQATLTRIDTNTAAIARNTEPPETNHE